MGYPSPLTLSPLVFLAGRGRGFLVVVSRCARVLMRLYFIVAESAERRENRTHAHSKDDWRRVAPEADRGCRRSSMN